MTLSIQFLSNSQINFLRTSNPFFRFGLLPRRHPITLVVGGAIHVPKVANPTSEMVDNIHSQYVAALRDLYNKHNPIYGDPKVKLEII